MDLYLMLYLSWTVNKNERFYKMHIQEVYRSSNRKYAGLDYKKKTIIPEN